MSCSYKKTGWENAPKRLLLIPMLIVLAIKVLSQAPPSTYFQWEGLPGLSPGSVRGAVIGEHNGVMILAGGENQDGEPQSDIYVFDPLAGHSRGWVLQPAKLPHALAYAAGAATPEGLVIAGGQDGEHYQRRVWRLRWESVRQTVTFDTLPSLPGPLAHAGAAYVNGTLYVAGGSAAPQGKPTATFLALDLHSGVPAWKKLPPWNGPPRLAAAATGQSNGLTNCFYLFGGYDGRRPLADAHVFDPAKEHWQKLDDIPSASAGATALPVGTAHILLFGGRRHPHTDQQGLLGYYTITDRWITADTLPTAVTAGSIAARRGKEVLIVTPRQKGGGATSNEPRTSRLIISQGVPDFGGINYLVLALYFLCLLWIGWFFSRRQVSIDDYFKGGGRVPWWAAGLSIFGTVLSAISFMAIPAKTFATDWSYLLYNLGPFYVAPLVIIFFLPFYRRLNVTTVYEYLERRFDVVIRLLGSLAFMIYQFGRIAIVLYLPAIALNIVTGIDILLCIGLVGGVSVIYTMMGGIEGVIWTDVLQVIVLMGGGLLCLGLIIWEYEDGPAALYQMALDHHKFNLIDARLNLREPTIIVAFLAGLFTNFIFYGTDQTVAQRYLTSSDLRGAVRSVWTNAFLILPGTLLFFAIGTALYAHYYAEPEALHPALEITDAIFPWFIVAELPQGISGLLISGIFAASMSSLSSSMNSVASAYTIDFHQRFGWGGTDLAVARWSTLTIGFMGTIFAMAMATSDIKSLWDEFLKVVGLITGGLGGVFFLGFTTRRVHATGALAGLIGSAVVQYFVAQGGTVHLLLYTATGFLSCVVLGYLASLVLPGKRKDLKGLTLGKPKT